MLTYSLVNKKLLRRTCFKKTHKLELFFLWFFLPKKKLIILSMIDIKQKTCYFALKNGLSITQTKIL